MNATKINQFNLIRKIIVNVHFRQIIQLNTYKQRVSKSIMIIILKKSVLYLIRRHIITYHNLYLFYACKLQMTQN